VLESPLVSEFAPRLLSGSVLAKAKVVRPGVLESWEFRLAGQLLSPAREMEPEGRRLVPTSHRLFLHERSSLAIVFDPVP